MLLPVLNLTMVWNRGVTFGLLNGFGQWSHLLLAGVALAVVVALGVWLRRAESPLVAIALGAIAGGAISNVIDRLRFGAVVDFIHAHVGVWSWYVFNVADAAIVCGVAALVLDSLLPRGAARRRRRTPPLDDDSCDPPQSPAKNSRDDAYRSDVGRRRLCWPPAPRRWPAAAR